MPKPSHAWHTRTDRDQANPEQARQQGAHARAADEAVALWGAASETGASAYLARKGVQPHGVRFAADGWLLVPLRDDAGQLCNLQRIAPEKPAQGTDKLFLKDGRKSGLWHQLGDPAGATVLLVAEGYATAASVFEATDRPVAVAFDAGNLVHVARALHKLHPAALIVIAGDDDVQTHARTGNNPGRDKAAAAARGASRGIAFSSLWRVETTRSRSEVGCIIDATTTWLQDIAMADYESRLIRGWRGRLDDETANAQQRVSAAPAQVVYIPGRESVSSDQLPGSTRWFNRVFGAERVEASLELSVLNELKRRIRTSELTEDQIQATRVVWRKSYHARRARQTAEQRCRQLEEKRAKRAMRTPEEIETERRWFREFRARQTEDWRVRQNEGKQRRRLANPEMHKAIDKRSSDRTRDVRNERRRARYKADPEKVMQSLRLYRLANLARTRAMRHASYLRNKAKRTLSAK